MHFVSYPCGFRAYTPVTMVLVARNDVQWPVLMYTINVEAKSLNAKQSGVSSADRI